MKVLMKDRVLIVIAVVILLIVAIAAWYTKEGLWSQAVGWSFASIGWVVACAMQYFFYKKKRP